MRTHLHIQQHPLRVALHNEIHARPPEAMTAPVAISHVVMVCNAEQRQASRAHVAALLRDHHLPPPDESSTHIRMDLGGFRLRWELHTVGAADAGFWHQRHHQACSERRNPGRVCGR